ncbi:hypothetical protein FKM82_030689 [Ascaphus truei]
MSGCAGLILQREGTEYPANKNPTLNALRGGRCGPHSAPSHFPRSAQPIRERAAGEQITGERQALPEKKRLVMGGTFSLYIHGTFTSSAP